MDNSGIERACAMEFVYRSRSQIDDLLNRIGEKLQLDKTRYKRAEASYLAVGEFINTSKSIFLDIDSEIYAQGSFAIQTTVKPLEREEYDLDFVFEMQIDFERFKNPLFFLDELERVFKNSGIYADKYERKNRCIRLKYANEFHMDILPACPDYHLGGTNLRVPDSETKEWIESNPKGYINWFENRCQEQLLMEKMAQVAPIPDDLPYEIKPPLKRAVQLLKRYRDKYFNGKEGKPRSIVLTTLAGRYYNNEDSVFDTISHSLGQINEFIDSTHGVITVKNPANESENLGDRWETNPEEYRMFRAFFKDFETIWSRLPYVSTSEQLTTVLADMFGETVSREVLKEASEYESMKALRQSPVIITNPPKPWGSSDELV
jgi:hypothetical protein